MNNTGDITPVIMYTTRYERSSFEKMIFIQKSGYNLVKPFILEMSEMIDKKIGSQYLESEGGIIRGI